ncbi:hypothetical protein Tco_0414049 [Tanacetum coccineum]
MYLTSSRPDIMFAVCACSRFQVQPKASHMHAVKRIFRYLKGQPTLGLWYPKDSLMDLIAYSDSDYAGASLDRKSTTGGCQFLGCRLISWQCKKQIIVSNSTTKAEYITASNCCGQFEEKLYGTVCKERLYGTMCLSAADYTSWILRLECKSCQVIKIGLEIKGYLINDGYADLMRMLVTLLMLLMFHILSSMTLNPEPFSSINFLMADVNLSIKTIRELVWKKVKEELSLDIGTSFLHVQSIMHSLCGSIRDPQRNNLLLNDEDGVTCLTNDEIFENLALMGYEQPSTKLTFQKGSFSPQ